MEMEKALNPVLLILQQASPSGVSYSLPLSYYIAFIFVITSIKAVSRHIAPSCGIALASLSHSSRASLRMYS